MKRILIATAVLVTTAIFTVACASPAAPQKNDQGGSGLTGTVSLSMTLHDIYPTTFTGNSSGGDDRNITASHPGGPAAYMGVNVWIEDNSGNYVKTVKYWLSDQKTTYGALYGDAAGWTHNGAATFADSTNGMARMWTSLYSPAHVSGVNGTDGVTAATELVRNPGTAYSATWDLKNFNGNAVAAGTYKVRILVMRHSFKTFGSTEYSYSINLAQGTDSTGSADSGFPLAQPGNSTTATTENGVATGISVSFTHG